MRVSMKYPSIFISVCLLWLPSAHGSANVVPVVSLELQRMQADLIVIGALGERSTCAMGRERLPCAEILVDVILKGEPEGLFVRRYLLLDLGVEETKIENLPLNGRLLMFVRRRDREMYEPVNGRHSILTIQNSGHGFATP